MASSVAQPTTVALPDPLDFSPKREPRSPFCCVFCGLSHIHPAIGCAASLGTCPYTNASDSGTVVDTGFGTTLVLPLATSSEPLTRLIDAPDFHACTVVNIDCGADADASDGPSVFIGTDKGISTSSVDGSSHRTDDGTNTWFSICSPGTVEHTIGTDTAPRVEGPLGDGWQAASAPYERFLFIVT